MSAGMYELYRSEVVRFYDCIPEKSNLKAVFNNICDAENSVVETHIKVHQKTQRGCGHLKFTLNLHHTASRMMANGKHIEIFLADHKKIVENIMCLDAVESLDKMLQEAVKSQLDSMTHISHSTISQSSHANNLSKTKKSPPSLTSTTREDTQRDDDSIAGSLDYCPSCKEMVEEGLACDLCGSWYYYTCENLTETDVLIIETQQEYYCHSCKHEHGEELLADSLIQNSMRNDDGSDGKDDYSAAPSHISTNCLNINYIYKHRYSDIPT